ncbi:MAG: hypothetical protein ACHQ50_03720 [Fimbriimonadales bacterium]
MILALAFATTLTLPARVDGQGYMRFVREGRIVYAGSATLTVDSGLLGSKGLPLTPAIRIPGSTIRIEADLSGNIVAVAPSGRTACGQLVLARFETRPVGDHGFFVSTTRASLGNPGEGLFGVIRTAGESSTTQGHQTTGITITVQPLTEVTADDVMLADIATVAADAQTKQALGGIIFCPAPSIGVDMPVTVSRIQALAKRAGIEAEVHVPPGAVVRRKAQTIKQEDFVATAIKAAQENLGAEVPMTCLDLQQVDFKAPLGRVELRSESVTTSGMNITVMVGVFVEDKRVNSRNVNLKPDASAQVQAGAPVKILMKSAGVTVEVPGRTRTGGMVGQTITVVTDTGSVLTGVIVATDKVVVKL